MIVGLTSGTFDLFHHSHLLFLERCKANCQKLIVGVDSNELVKKTKGPKRPIHDEIHRFNLLSSLAVVDLCFILKDLEQLTRISLEFNVAKLFKCERFKDVKPLYGVEGTKAELVIIPDLPGMVSTSQIINSIMDKYYSPYNRVVP